MAERRCIDEDGHCSICGYAIDMESETMESHECPPGFTQPPHDDLTAERAAKFIKQHFTEILRDDGEPWVGDVELIQDLIKTARREALREARETVLAEILEDIPDNEADESYNLAIGHAAHALDRLASEGAPAPIDLLPKLNDDGSYGEHF